MIWWPVFTWVGCLWWLVPLVVLGKVQPAVPRLHRDSRRHDLPHHPFDTLRGTTAWIPYVESAGGRATT